MQSEDCLYFSYICQTSIIWPLVEIKKNYKMYFEEPVINYFLRAYTGF